MLEWILKFFSWISVYFFWIFTNSSNIYATVCIITLIFGVIIRKRNEHNWLKKFGLDKQTKQSMKYYVPTRGLEIDPCDQEVIDYTSSFELIPFFMNAFKKSDSQYFIILADSGMGKTTFLLKCFFKYKRKILKKYKIVLIPLSQNQALEEIKKVKNKQKTILLLDSFDEDECAMEDYVNRLYEICKETESFYKVVMTCRTQFFPDSENEPRITGNKKFSAKDKNVVFKKYYIAYFTDSEINRYLKKKYNRFFQKNKFEQALKLIMNCPQLVIRPMLLSYIDDLVEDQEKAYDKVYEIYDQLVNKWIEREALKNNKLLYEFSEKVAEYMYLNKTVYIGGSEIEDLCKEYKINLRSIEAKSRSLLNRNANGDYKFAHKSILEFFLFKKSFKEEEFRKNVISNGFNGYDMLELFMKEKSLAYLQDLLQDNSGKSESSIFKDFIFSNGDLSGMSIINCNFEECVFAKTNFKISYFENVNFTMSDLEGAIFLGADLRNTRFNHVNLKKCEFRNAYFENTDLEGADLEWAKLEGAYLKGINLQEANLEMASLSWASLAGANLIGANLNHAILINCDFREAFLRDVALNKAYLLYSQSKYLFEYDHNVLDIEYDFKRSLEGADLTGADLSGANLSNMNFQSAKLVFADLSKSILVNSNLIQADLRGADLNVSIWYESDIRKARSQLKTANFTYLMIIEDNELKKVEREKLFYSID